MLTQKQVKKFPHYWDMVNTAANTNNSTAAETGDCLATTDIGRKVRGCYAPFQRELGPHLTQCGLGRGLPPYQVAS